MIDMPLSNVSNNLDTTFKKHFLVPSILPGENDCMMQYVIESDRPSMGPYLYVTKPGSFTGFHKDGNVRNN